MGMKKIKLKHIFSGLALSAVMTVGTAHAQTFQDFDDPLDDAVFGTTDPNPANINPANPYGPIYDDQYNNQTQNDRQARASNGPKKQSSINPNHILFGSIGFIFASLVLIIKCDRNLCKKAEQAYLQAYEDYHNSQEPLPDTSSESERRVRKRARHILAKQAGIKARINVMHKKRPPQSEENFNMTPETP